MLRCVKLFGVMSIIFVKSWSAYSLHLSREPHGRGGDSHSIDYVCLKKQGEHSNLVVHRYCIIASHSKSNKNPP